MAVAMLIPMLAKAQDVVTVMQYNLLEYGNYNSAWADCYETNNNTQMKDECIREILNYVQPDILTVNEFGATDKLCEDFLKHNLNINGVDYWRADNRINYAASNIINHIFYDSRKFGLKRHVALRTEPRDTDFYELYGKTASLAAGDTIKLICVVAHLKAGMNYEGSRRAQLQTIMDYIYNHYPEDNVLIMGDFNMYSSAETGYQLLTSTYSHPNIRFVDPVASIGGVGPWNENQNYARFHTQATASWIDNDCRSGGGLDDRFDFILMADEIAFGYHDIRYVSDSYQAVGNDGQHFNQSVNQGNNSSAPASVVEAVFNCSDHLPVTMKMTVNAHLSVDEQFVSQFGAAVAPNPASDDVDVCFYKHFDGAMRFDIYNMQGQKVASESAHFGSGNQLHRMDISRMAEGFYLLRISDGHRIETLKLLVQKSS